MAGIDRNTGKMIDGWAHVQQSLGVLFTTSLNSRVMRRYVGTNVPRQVDSPMSPLTLMDCYAAAAASAKFEPRFRITKMQVITAEASGQLSIAIQGVYYPRGHLGDFTVSEPKTASVPL